MYWQGWLVFRPSLLLEAGEQPCLEGEDKSSRREEGEQGTTLESGKVGKGDGSMEGGEK